MNRLLGALMLAAAGVAALAVATPGLVRLLAALQPVLIIVGVLLIIARVIWYLTDRRRW